MLQLELLELDEDELELGKLDELEDDELDELDEDELDELDEDELDFSTWNGTLPSIPHASPRLGQ